MSNGTERDGSSADTPAMKKSLEKGTGSSGEFKSQWFYVYRVSEHDGPAQCYRLKRRKTAYDEVATELPSIVDDVFERPSFGTALGDIALRHIGYVMVLLDHPTEKIDDVTFTISDTNPPENYVSFTDGKPVASIAEYPNLSAFYCKNHMLIRDGSRRLRRGEAQGFIMKVAHSPRLGGGNKDPRGHEDAGTNLGPPKNEA